MDLRTDDLPRHSFDLVHARALLMHIPQRQQILDQLLGALRPGGVLLLEDADHFPIAAVGTGLYAEVFEAFLGSAVRAGMAKDWARQLPNELHRRGFRDVWTECDASLYEGGCVQSEFWRLSLAQARDLVIAEGISPERIDEWDRLLAELVPEHGHRRGLRTRRLGPAPAAVSTRRQAGIPAGDSANSRR
jgi:SAM-dependent methyltransferase